MFVRRLALGLVLAATVTVAAGALYRWVDEHGRVQYSDTPPDKKGAVQLSNRGIVLKKIDALTPEQQKIRDAEEARKRADEARAAEQRRQDSALLQSFTTVQEIDMKRDREVQALEISIANLREQERSLSARLAEDRKRVEALERSKKPPSDALREDIVRAEAEKKVFEDEIKRRYDDIASTRARYDALKKRYILLRQEAAMIEPASAAAVPAKK
jgi:chromosome segregation ATPase